MSIITTRPVARLALCIAALLAALPALAEIYRWTDAQGRVHYTDTPPPDRKAAQVKIKVNSITGPAVVSQRPGSQPAGPRPAVKLYTAPWCGYCKQAKAHLAARSIPFSEVDVEGSDGARREFAALGGRGVPVILVGGQRMDGFDGTALNAMLANAGY